MSYVSKRFRTFRKPITRKPKTVRWYEHPMSRTANFAWIPPNEVTIVASRQLYSTVTTATRLP